MTRTCFFFFRNPLNVSPVRWCTSLATSLQSFSGGGGGGGSFGLSIQTQTNKKLTQRFWYVNNIRKNVGQTVHSFLFFPQIVEIELLPLRATSLFSKVPSQAGDGYQICLKGGSGGLHPSPLKILYPPPPQYTWNKDATSRQSARSRRYYGKIRGCKQSNYINKILGGPNGGNLQEDAP